MAERAGRQSRACVPWPDLDAGVLDRLDREALDRQGFLLIRGGVPQSAVRAILGEIKFIIRDQLAKFGMAPPPKSASLSDLVRYAFVPRQPAAPFPLQLPASCPIAAKLLRFRLCNRTVETAWLSAPCDDGISDGALRHSRRGEVPDPTSPGSAFHTLRARRDSLVSVGAGERGTRIGEDLSGLASPRTSGLRLRQRTAQHRCHGRTG